MCRERIFLVVGVIFPPLFLLEIVGSFNFGDVLLLSISLALTLAALVNRSAMLLLWIRSRRVLVLASLFIFSGMASGFVAVQSAYFSAEQFVSVTSQYAFVFIVFPIVASSLTTTAVKQFFRGVSIGYAIPMAAVLLSVTGIHFSLPGGAELFSYGRAVGFFGNANSYALILCIVAPIYLYLGLCDKAMWRVFGMLGFAALLVNVTLTASFGGVFVLVGTLGIAVVVVLFYGKTTTWRKPSRHFAFFIFFAGGATLLLQLSGPGIFTDDRSPSRFEQLSTLRDLSEIQYLGSFDIRAELIAKSANSIASRGIGGRGLGQSNNQSGEEWDVHLTYLLLWQEGGIAVVLFYVLILVCLIINAVGVSAQDKDLGIALIICVCALALAGFVTTHIYLRVYWLPVLAAFAGWSDIVSVMYRKRLQIVSTA